MGSCQFSFTEERAMTDLFAIPAAVVDERTISLGEVLRHAKVTCNMEFLHKAIDGHLIERAIEREQIEVTEREIDETLARAQASQRALVDSQRQRAETLARQDLRDETRKTILFGKLKGKVTQELMQGLSPVVVDALDSKSKCVLRDMLFLHWMKSERQHAKIDLQLLQAV
jgi:hypothetical protein